MPRIRLHREQKGNTYKTEDRLIKQYFDMSGTKMYVHKMIGHYEKDGTVNGKKIQDLILMETRDRAYDETVFTEYGVYQIADGEFSISQIGFFSADSILIDFHLNAHVENIGRKISAGDVLEITHLRDDMIEDQEGAMNAYYVVKDARRPAEGYGTNWMPHLWRVRCKKMTASKEYSDIIEDADDFDILMSQMDRLDEIDDGVLEEAAQAVPSNDSVTDNLYKPEFKNAIELEEGEVIDLENIDRGTIFPVDAVDGDYFIRSDYRPQQLFKVVNGNWVMLNMQEIREKWTRGHAYQNSFIQNDSTFTNDSGEVEQGKTSIKKAGGLRLDE